MAQTPSGIAHGLLIGDSSSVLFLRQCVLPANQNLSDEETTGTNGEAGNNVRNIVIPPINRGDAHAHEERQANPEKPTAIAPRRKNCRH